MGSCNYRTKKYIVKGEAFSENYKSQRKAIITQLIDVHFNAFKENLLNNILLQFPISLIELNRLILNSYTIYDNNFLQECKNKRVNSIHTQKALKIFSSKLKSQEGYIRYFNDLASLRYTHDLKKQLILEFIEDCVPQEELIQKYHKKIKGTYSLQGLHELLGLFHSPSSETIETLDQVYEENLLKLKALYSDILTSKIIDFEIFSKTFELPNINIEN